MTSSQIECISHSSQASHWCQCKPQKYFVPQFCQGYGFFSISGFLCGLCECRRTVAPQTQQVSLCKVFNTPTHMVCIHVPLHTCSKGSLHDALHMTICCRSYSIPVKVFSWTWYIHQRPGQTSNPLHNVFAQCISMAISCRGFATCGQAQCQSSTYCTLLNLSDAGFVVAQAHIF